MRSERKAEIWKVLGVITLVFSSAALSLLAGCSREAPSELAFRQAIDSSEERPLEDVRDDLREIIRKWPDSHAALKAEREIKWISEQIIVETRGPSLLAWDAARTVASAAETYRLAKGRFPETFSDLVPQYLDGPVLDPWGFEIVYRQTEAGYKVVCYGEDGLPGGVDLATDLVIDTNQVVGGLPEL